MYESVFSFGRVMALVLAVMLLNGCASVAPDSGSPDDALPASQPTAQFSDYKLDAGDLISIQVFGEEDLSVERARLSDAGTISYPILGELQVSKMTARQIEKALTERLDGDYLIDPKVNVTVLEYRQFYINGEVRSPGGFSFRPGLTIRKALALAGGLTERASTSSFTVVSEQDASTREVGLNYVINPGDIITIDESFF